MRDKRTLMLIIICIVMSAWVVPCIASGAHIHAKIPVDQQRQVNRPASRAACSFTKSSVTAAGYYGAYANGMRTVTYYDPALACSPTYPFQITAISFPLYNDGTASWPVQLDVVVYALATPGVPCNGPGSELCRFSVNCDEATFGFPIAGTATFPTPCCISGPVYIGLEYNNPTVGIYPSILFDNNAATVTCDNWNFFTDQNWYEWYAFWNPPVPGYPMYFIDGETESIACAPPCDCRPGDANGDLSKNISDAVYIIARVFSGGPPATPYPICSCDANCDCVCNISDPVFMIAYIFSSGPAPCDCTAWLGNCGPPLR